MAFFNYSSMQMTAKIVYYGPGLGGKTTNLEYIYGHTTDDSRGEMVSLETQTDRTLFFDLLPMEVGSVAGFDTKIQLYTVPGQVFYNSTRKLVLKGADGVVFVADSQRPMMQSNIDALGNLEENLGEIGLTLDTTPLVLQYNKRDLPDIVAVEEMNDRLNANGWPMLEASALSGVGVFETLREISKLTLVSLREELEASAAAEADGQAPASKPDPGALSAPAAPPAKAEEPTLDESKLPHSAQLRRDFILRLPAEEFSRAEIVSAQLKVKDAKGKTLRASQTLEFHIEQHDALEEVLVRLNLNMKAED